MRRQPLSSAVVRPSRRHGLRFPQAGSRMSSLRRHRRRVPRPSHGVSSPAVSENSNDATVALSSCMRNSFPSVITISVRVNLVVRSSLRLTLTAVWSVRVTVTLLYSSAAPENAVRAAAPHKAAVSSLFMIYLYSVRDPRPVNNSINGHRSAARGDLCLSARLCPGNRHREYS